MKYLILPIILGIVFLTTYQKGFTASEGEMIAEIKKVESDFQKEYGIKNCSVKGSDVSLGAVMYALAIQEGGRKDGTLGDKTNNRGSLHGTMNIKKPVKFVRGDGTKTRPVYKTAYDGLYEKAWMITHKKVYNNCDIGYKQLYAYIVGPNAKPNAIYSGNRRYTNSQWVSNRLEKLLGNAKKFDNVDKGAIENEETIENKNTKVENKSVKNTKKQNSKCVQKSTINNNQYLQIDNEYGNMENQINLSKGDKVFICNK